MEIRFAQKGDEVGIHDLIIELARYEKEEEAVVNTSAQLGEDLFENNLCEAFVAIDSNQIVGFALFYVSYSTWKGACLYLEDFYVKEDMRGTGCGSALFDKVVELARKRKYRRMDWQVLDWNTTAIDFYKRKQACIEDQWLNGRMYFD